MIEKLKNNIEIISLIIILIIAGFIWIPGFFDCEDYKNKEAEFKFYKQEYYINCPFYPDSIKAIHTFEYKDINIMPFSNFIVNGCKVIKYGEAIEIK